MTCEHEIVISEKDGLSAWKLVYRDDGIAQPGFYFVNAGDPQTCSAASKDSVFRALKKLVDAQVEDLIDANC